MSLPSNEIVDYAFARVLFPGLAKPRDPQSHKGTHGTLAIIGGAAGMSGAIVLAGRAAIKQGAGKVHLGFLQAQLPIAYDFEQPELMLAKADDLLQRTDIDAWVIGCGLGQSQDAHECVQRCLNLKTDTPLLLDADGLNLLAKSQALQAGLTQSTSPKILTPHEAEAARILNIDIADVKQYRQAAAKELATTFAAWVVLKGAASIICSPQGEFSINPSGNAALATAGSGDVLSGLCGSLLAQGLEIDQAVRGAVWIHGAAADLAVHASSKKHRIGPIGFTAHEIIDFARHIRNQVAYGHE
ncbi:NAD(P)H-hydrate dehydratase [Brackiella oedipodis]|uniref:NAD(P)H-hydrate dehydratase n=1 Tax=Brackiella oedipodis TaxID=124225 RepID=UPI00048A98FD|nr:NAD(P)H-hydrate dehydratase [Brackiella oedipodis]